MSNEYTTSIPKIALVTGGSRGIGRNTVVSLAKRGVHTIFTYHSHSADADAVVAAVRDAGAQAIALQLDAGNCRVVRRLCRKRERRTRQSRSHAFRLPGQ